MVSNDCCPCCGGSVAAAFEATDRNRRLGARTFSYGRCGRCGLLRLLDPPHDLERYYTGEYYRSPSLRAVRAAARRQRYQLEHLRPHVGHGHVVEIGAAWGVFALQAKEASYEVTALEMHGPCVQHLRSEIGVEATRTANPGEVVRDLGPIDAVVMWQTIEHLPDPFGTLEACLEALRPGGVILLATPNPEALGFRVLRASWPHVDAPRHLYLLPPDALAAWMLDRGARQVAFTVTDKGARRWNRFAWSRWLMNQVTNRYLQRAVFMLGVVVAALLAPLERSGRNGSCYTVVFRKEPT